jgi:hypothetical protein
MMKVDQSWEKEEETWFLEELRERVFFLNEAMS